jgi:hypothetical protein
MNPLIEKLRHHVTGAIERGEKQAIVEIGTELLNEEARAVSLEREIEQAEKKAARLGAVAGRNAAEWVIQDTWGGRVTRGEKEAAQAFLAALDEGDFASLPVSPNLSGEWAGDETPSSLVSRLLGDDWDECEEYLDAQDSICAEWEIAAEDAFLSTLSASAQSLLS